MSSEEISAVTDEVIPVEDKVEDRLGKIVDIQLGLQNVDGTLQFGLFYIFGSKKDWNVQFGSAYYAGTPNEKSEWTEESQSTAFSDIMKTIHNLVVQANVQTLSQLKDYPVMCRFVNAFVS